MRKHRTVVNLLVWYHPNTGKSGVLKTVIILNILSAFLAVAIAITTKNWYKLLQSLFMKRSSSKLYFQILSGFYGVFCGDAVWSCNLVVTNFSHKENKFIKGNMEFTGIMPRTVCKFSITWLLRICQNLGSYLLVTWCVGANGGRFGGMSVGQVERWTCEQRWLRRVIANKRNKVYGTLKVSKVLVECFKSGPKDYHLVIASTDF